MTFDVNIVLTIVSMVACMIIFYFVQMRGFDQRLDSTKEVLRKEINGIAITQAEHGVRLDNNERFVSDISRRINNHCNGTQKAETGS